MKVSKFLTAVAVAGLVAGAAVAATVTNRDEVIEVTLLSERAEGSTTVTKDQSVWPNMGVDRRGIYVITYTIPATGVGLGADLTNTVDMVSWSIPKGTIFEEDAIIEVATAVLPSTGTLGIGVGGVTLLALGNDLESTGIKDLDVGPAITTADGIAYLQIADVTATQGVFTVYLPVILGNAQ